MFTCPQANMNTPQKPSTFKLYIVIEVTKKNIILLYLSKIYKLPFQNLTIKNSIKHAINVYSSKYGIYDDKWILKYL
jgi:hypothetical protein